MRIDQSSNWIYCSNGPLLVLASRYRGYLNIYRISTPGPHKRILTVEYSLDSSDDEIIETIRESLAYLCRHKFLPKSHRVLNAGHFKRRQ